MTNGATTGGLAVGAVLGDRYALVRKLDDPCGVSRFEALVVGGDGAPAPRGDRVWLHLLGAVPSAAAVRRIERGAKALRGSRELHLLEVLDVVEEGGQCLVMSAPFGAPSLAEVVAERGPLPTSVALETATQICGALLAGQQMGVEARAVGPSDVFMQGVAVGNGDSAPTDWQRPQSRVLLHRPPTNGASTGEPDEESGLVAVVGRLLWAMLAGELSGATEAAATATPAVDVDSLGALRELWDAPPLPDELTTLLAGLLADGALRRPATLEGLATELRSLSSRLAGSWEPPRKPSNAPSAADTDPEPGDRASWPASAPDEASAPLDLGRSTVPSPGAAIAREGVGAESEPATAAVEGESTERGHIGTTMKSNRDSALDLPVARGAKVKLLVRDAPPASDGELKGVAPAVSSGSRPPAWDDDRGERRVWAVVALLAAVAAIAVGIVLGAC